MLPRCRVVNGLFYCAMEYKKFLKKKIPLASFDGYDCEISDINPLLREHQSAIVQWAVKGARAVFEAASKLRVKMAADNFPFRVIVVFPVPKKLGGGWEFEPYTDEMP